MRVLVACEFSGVVRDAFLARGHDAISCDLLPTDRPGPHIQGDVRDVLRQPWDLVIAHPPCTHLASSGARWWKTKPLQLQIDAIQFVHTIYYDTNSPSICIENPVGRLGTAWLKPTQVIQPYHFGHAELKTTCLWLKGLPRLVPTDVVKAYHNRLHYLPPSAERWKLRSETYPGIARAMAEQWGGSV